jgi:hypothetical protein
MGALRAASLHRCFRGLFGGLFVGTSSREDSDHAVISLVTRVLADVIVGLNQLNVIVVPARHHRRSGVESQNAPLPEGSVLRAGVCGERIPALLRCQRLVAGHPGMTARPAPRKVDRQHRVSGSNEGFPAYLSRLL